MALFSRKKKKDKEKKRLEQQALMNQNDDEEKMKNGYIDKRTPAQMAFDKTQEKRVSGSLRICLAPIWSFHSQMLSATILDGLHGELTFQYKNNHRYTSVLSK